MAHLALRALGRGGGVRVCASSTGLASLLNVDIESWGTLDIAQDRLARRGASQHSCSTCNGHHRRWHDISTSTTNDVKCVQLQVTAVADCCSVSHPSAE